MPGGGGVAGDLAYQAVHPPNSRQHVNLGRHRWPPCQRRQPRLRQACGLPGSEGRSGVQTREWLPHQKRLARPGASRETPEVAPRPIRSAPANAVTRHEGRNAAARPNGEMNVPHARPHRAGEYLQGRTCPHLPLAQGRITTVRWGNLRKSYSASLNRPGEGSAVEMPVVVAAKSTVRLAGVPSTPHRTSARHARKGHPMVANHVATVLQTVAINRVGMVHPMAVIPSAPAGLAGRVMRGTGSITATSSRMAVW